MIALKIVGVAGEVLAVSVGVRSLEEASPLGQYVKTYDPDAAEGQGFATGTANIREALHFTDTAAALAFWRQPSKVAPTRPDGRPNRPLTAFSVEMVTVPPEPKPIPPPVFTQYQTGRA
jgi:hypothetical protein